MMKTESEMVAGLAEEASDTRDHGRWTRSGALLRMTKREAGGATASLSRIKKRGTEQHVGCRANPANQKIGHSTIFYFPSSPRGIKKKRGASRRDQQRPDHLHPANLSR